MFRAFVLIVLLLPSVSAAELYQWTDANGVKHFSNTPPTTDTAEVQRMGEYVGSDGGDTDHLRKTIDLYRSADDREVVGSSAGRLKNSPTVVMYTTPTCGYCHRAKAYFNQRGVRFTEYDVTTSPKARRDFEALNGRGVPLIVIGDQRIYGFNKTAINRALGLQ